MDRNTAIQGLWVGPSLSVMEQMSILSFIKHGHEYHLYVYDEDIEGIPKGATLKDADQILPRSRIPGHREQISSGFSDIFRYRLLLEKGGYWVDTDVVCLRPFAFGSDYVFGQNRTRDPSKSIASAVIKAPVGCELIKSCYDRSLELEKDLDKLKWAEVGPTLLTQAVKKCGLTEYALPCRTFSPIDWWNWGDFISGRLVTRIKTSVMLRKGVYAVHLWNEIWRREKLDKNATYHPRCLYEKFKRMYL